MKLHKPLVQAIVNSLQQVFSDNKYTDKVLEKTFKQNAQFGSRDRRFIAENVYDIVRNYRLLSEITQSPKNFWIITGSWLALQDIDISHIPDFKTINPESVRKTRNSFQDKPAVFESYPDWLCKLCIGELGEERWWQEAHAMNEQAEVILRVNTLKTTRSKLAEKLAEAGIETAPVDGYEQALMLKKRQNIFGSALFRDGLFEIQDAGSQAISEFLQAEPGMQVIDACSGGGGKALHLAAIMQNKGRIIAMDVEAWKLDNLKTRAKRAGAFNIEPRLIEDQKTIKRLDGKADRLLLDVPCSGLGVIKRNPDAKWKLSAEFIEKTKTLQQTILTEYSAMLKPGGLMVYSTCSILPGENRQQVDTFLKDRSHFELLKDHSILPSEGFDGFYMALLKRH
ncbi:MAG: RsmB/NOP family class I SAM-dependent RNA methyltransferase [Bacteroidetes bacterium]|nr:RsmB/NOP family class I SAM-dependent RNA methyltransferase [Bacteroidota bacterium]